MNHKQIMFMSYVNEALPSHKQPLWGMFTQVHANVMSEHMFIL